MTSASLSSCDTFHGSLVAMTLTWPFPPLCTDMAGTTPPGCQVVQQPALLPMPSQHIEMWGKFSTGEVRRLVANVGNEDPAKFTGFTVVPALDPNDACLVRSMDRDDQDCGIKSPPAANNLATSICGAQLFSKKAHSGTDISDTDALLAQQQLVLQGRKITSRLTPFLAVDSGTSMTTGNAAATLLTLVQWNPDYMADPRSKFPKLTVDNAGLDIVPAVTTAVPTSRSYECTQYREDVNNPDNRHPYFYVGNPHQITKPLSGVQFGFLGFSTGPGSTSPNVPAQNFNGISFYLPGSADDLAQIVITLESRYYTEAKLDAMALPLFLATRLPENSAGRGVIRMVVLANSMPQLGPTMPVFNPANAVGTISIITDIDSGLN